MSRKTRRGLLRVLEYVSTPSPKSDALIGRKRIGISFRPHHFLCTLGFQGKGYSPEFIANFKAIVEALQTNEELPIEVVAKGDSICGACPHQENGMCEQEEKIQGLDARHSQVLSIHPGDIIPWKQARVLLKEKMSVEAFHQACSGCSWKASGICEAALRKLHQ